MADGPKRSIKLVLPQKMVIGLKVQAIMEEITVSTLIEAMVNKFHPGITELAKTDGE